MSDWLQLRERPTLVVGAGGLGGAGVQALALAGARVLVADVDADHLEAVRLRAKEAGAEIHTMQTD